MTCPLLEVSLLDCVLFLFNEWTSTDAVSAQFTDVGAVSVWEIH